MVPLAQFAHFQPPSLLPESVSRVCCSLITASTTVCTAAHWLTTACLINTSISTVKLFYYFISFDQVGTSLGFTIISLYLEIYGQTGVNGVCFVDQTCAMYQRKGCVPAMSLTAALATSRVALATLLAVVFTSGSHICSLSFVHSLPCSLCSLWLCSVHNWLTARCCAQVA